PTVCASKPPPNPRPLCGCPRRRATLALSSAPRHVGRVNDGTSGIEWRVGTTPVPYQEALAFMEQRVAAIRAGEAPECVWLLEHPPLFTAGTSADPSELTNPDNFPVFDA